MDIQVREIESVGERERASARGRENRRYSETETVRKRDRQRERESERERGDLHLEIVQQTHARIYRSFSLSFAGSLARTRSPINVMAIRTRTHTQTHCTHKHVKQTQRTFDGACYGT